MAVSVEESLRTLLRHKRRWTAGEARVNLNRVGKFKGEIHAE